ncbi:MAG TPA: hypothetical protein DEQ02_10965 [Ruminococcaceae bacterium]|nr:hypothetical protein [Oscillospiraceae bacterium]
MKNFLARLLNMLVGLMLYALGIVLTINANVGYAPWEVFHVGLADTVGLTIGMASIIAGVVIVIIVTAMGEKLGLGTIASMILTGVFIDIIVLLDVIPAAGNLAIGIVMLVAGMFIIALGSYFYMKAAFGVGPRDNLMVVLTRKTKIPVGVCRLLVELLVTFIGWLLGGMVGIGTVIAFVAIGVCVQLVFTLFKFDVTALEHETLKDTFSGMRRRKR